VSVRADGAVGITGNYGADKARYLRKDRWHTITVTVDCCEHQLVTYVDGKPACHIIVPDIMVDGRFAVNRQLTLFGSKEAAVARGGNVRVLLFETKSLLPQEVETLYQAMQAEGMWTCGNCTVRNQASSMRCSVCDAKKPSAVADTLSQWQCKACTVLNSASSTTCSVCDTPRS